MSPVPGSSLKALERSHRGGVPIFAPMMSGVCLFFNDLTETDCGKCSILWSLDLASHPAGFGGILRGD
jgi:hypothetical protein